MSYRALGPSEAFTARYIGGLFCRWREPCEDSHRLVLLYFPLCKGICQVSFLSMNICLKDVRLVWMYIGMCKIVDALNDTFWKKCNLRVIKRKYFGSLWLDYHALHVVLVNVCKYFEAHLQCVYHRPNIFSMQYSLNSRRTIYAAFLFPECLGHGSNIFIL